MPSSSAQADEVDKDEASLVAAVDNPYDLAVQNGHHLFTVNTQRELFSVLSTQRGEMRPLIKP